MIFKEWKEFTRAYARSFRGAGEIVLFFVSLAAFFLGLTIQFVGTIGTVFFCVLLVFAGKSAWSAEHKKYITLKEELAVLKDSSLSFEKLDPIQQEIILSIANASDKRLAIINTLQGTIYMGLESITEKYDEVKVESEIMDLVQKGLLSQSENFGKNNNRLYKPTKLFFGITDSIS